MHRYNGPMHRIHIIGRKNSGKTTLVVDLVRHFRAQGYRVGTIKHTHHHHELDTPGKDSFRHRQAGAKAVGIVAPTMSAIFWPSPSDKTGAEECKAGQTEQKSMPTSPLDVTASPLDVTASPVEVPEQADDLSRQYEPFDALMVDCDLVLVEGDQQAQAVKIEVWHQGVEERPLVENNGSIALVVSNDPVNAPETHRRDDLQSLGQRLLELAEIDLAGVPNAAEPPNPEESIMKEKQELEHLITKIASPDSPVGMDAVYVHALILDKLQQLDERLQRLERTVEAMTDSAK